MSVENLIESINYFVNKRYGKLLRMSSEDILLSGGCYEFVKILRNYYPLLEVYISNDHSHCGAMIDGKLYDATGIISDSENFHKASSKEIEYIENYFGERFDLFLIADSVIDDLNEVLNNKRVV